MWQIVELMDEETAGIMITNPNTLGLFEENIREIAEIVHEKGGLVYGDGANMNAVMGIADMKKCGVDVLHLNLHKTFSTPHGGGGPGAGPVCVVEKLAKFLPAPRVEFDGRDIPRWKPIALNLSAACTVFTATTVCWSGRSAISLPWGRKT